MGETYEAAGVSIGAGEAAVDAIKADVRSTFRPEVHRRHRRVRRAVPVRPDEVRRPGAGVVDRRRRARRPTSPPRWAASTRSGWTWSRCASTTWSAPVPSRCSSWTTSRSATSTPRTPSSSSSGVADGCRQAGCALIGGEMAEHPGMMAPGEFDLVGFAVGVVDRARMITGERVTPGDVLIGLPSPGLRSNGYSLARRADVRRGGPVRRRPRLGRCRRAERRRRAARARR